MALSTKTSPPVPLPSPLTEGYWRAAKEHRLAIQQCAACGRFHHMPEHVCPGCLGTDFKWTTVSGRGTITHRVIIPAGQSRVRGFAESDAFAIIAVELPEQEGLTVVANLRGAPATDAVIGRAVEVMFEDIADGVVLPQFRLAATT